MKQTIHPRLQEAACAPIETVLQGLGIDATGLRRDQVPRQQKKYGSNDQLQRNRTTVAHCVLRAFLNPFSIILFVLGIISLCTNVLLPEAYGQGLSSVVIIACMILLSGVVRLMQELKAKAVADRLTSLVQTTVSVCRDGTWQELLSTDLVVGDLVRLEAGDRVPADLRLWQAQDFFVSQSVITGESGSFEKTAQPMERQPQKPGAYQNTVFQGTTVTGGRAVGVVLAVGGETVYGSLTAEPQEKKPAFDVGAGSIAWVLIKFMSVLVPVVFLACGLTKGNWLEAFLFSLSVAVGLTPELLPMVVSACLAKGSFQMSKKQTVVRNVSAMQTLGSVDLLCVDKTGTLTGDKVELEYFTDILGNESAQVLDYAFLNSHYHSGVQNHLDSAILKCRTMPGREDSFAALVNRHPLLDEQPFDYAHRFVGVLVKGEGTNLHIIKGSVQNVVSVCSTARYRDELVPIGADAHEGVQAVVEDFTEDGMKVLAVAYKETEGDALAEGERDFTLLGYLAFFDAPKASAAEAIRRLKNLKIDIRVLTGDDVNTTLSVCSRLGLATDAVLTGAELDRLSENDLPLRVEQTRIFGELSPKQKARIVELLQQNGHAVGFLGDGMNDLPAELQADVGISVDTAAEAVKESADVILLKKDLNVLEQGILEGRKAFVNMTKYIKITASSNFGNICAVVIASILLPFFPMASLLLLLLNLLYDILCLILPWDNVDEEQLQRPIRWSGRNLAQFMLRFGPISSVFDVLTFAFLYFVLCPQVCGGAFYSLGTAGQAAFVALFQTGWFLESMWTQVLILHLLRTSKLPFLQSKPAPTVFAVTIVGVLLFTCLAMTPVGAVLGLTTLPGVYYLFLVPSVIGYLLLVSVVKYAYFARHRELL